MSKSMNRAATNVRRFSSQTPRGISFNNENRATKVVEEGQIDVPPPVVEIKDHYSAMAEQAEKEEQRHRIMIRRAILDGMTPNKAVSMNRLELKKFVMALPKRPKFKIDKMGRIVIPTTDARGYVCVCGCGSMMLAEAARVPGFADMQARQKAFVEIKDVWMHTFSLKCARRIFGKKHYPLISTLRTMQGSDQQKQQMKQAA